MAGIEKICEFSGEYPSGLMYGYKKNQLQIMPKYRKLFRKAKHTLYIGKPDKFLAYKKIDAYIFTTNFERDLKRKMESYEPPFTSVKEFLDYFDYKIISKYPFALVVEDEKLFGEVNGIYSNDADSKKCMNRKIKRLLRSKDVNIVYVDNIREVTNKIREARSQ